MKIHLEINWPVALVLIVLGVAYGIDQVIAEDE